VLEDESIERDKSAAGEPKARYVRRLAEKLYARYTEELTRAIKQDEADFIEQVELLEKLGYKATS
jgi:hypothetical protein